MNNIFQTDIHKPKVYKQLLKRFGDTGSLDFTELLERDYMIKIKWLLHNNHWTELKYDIEKYPITNRQKGTIKCQLTKHTNTQKQMLAKYEKKHGELPLTNPDFYVHHESFITKSSK